MNPHIVSCAYRQFYVADAELEPSAPEDWKPSHVDQRHNTLEHIAALCPDGDITARVYLYGPKSQPPQLHDKADFEVRTSIRVPSGRVGVYGWPWELLERFEIPPGECQIRFTGYRTDLVDDGQDYYVVELAAGVDRGFTTFG